MSNQSPYYALDNLAEMIQSFLAAPPAGMPSNLITALAEAILPGRSLLPPRLFYEAVEQAQMAISITDLKANILYANPAFERVTGYNRMEIIGQNESILSDKSTPPLVYETLWARLHQQKPWSGLLLNKHKEGERYLAEVSIAPVLNANKETTYYLAMHRDVTQVHRLEQQVKNQKALIESVVDLAPIVIALLNANNQVILSNQEYKKLVKDLQGHEPANIFLAAIQDTLKEKWTQLRTHESRFVDQEVRFDAGGHDQPRWFVCSGTWFHERDGSADAFFEMRNQDYFLLVAKEVSDLKHQQEEVRMNGLRALLAEEELTEGMRETLAGALHQLQGPINLISAALEMLKRRAVETNQTKDPLCITLQDTLEASNQVLDNLRQCIPLSENESEQVEPVNLNELLRDVLTISTQRLLREGVTVDWQPALILPPVLGNIGHLRGLFKQLIDNAMDAMNESRYKQRDLRIITTNEEDIVRVIIEDTGPGIPESLRFKVFEPFFTTKKASRRTGMGLATVQDIVNRYAGTIHLDSEYTQGCRFIIQFLTAHHRKN